MNAIHKLYKIRTTCHQIIHRMDMIFSTYITAVRNVLPNFYTNFFFKISAVAVFSLPPSL
jgi:hypothetical protein